MADENWRKVSDPEAQGLPGTADDDSTAGDDVHSPREADGPQPWPLPPDRDEGPLALDEHGLTMWEQRTGESLETRLAREEPDVDPGEPAVADSLSDEGQPDPHLGSQISMYDRDRPAHDTPVTRLVAPDEGTGGDFESTSIARDAGVAGGGPSAEEAAMHATDEESEAAALEADERESW